MAYTPGTWTNGSGRAISAGNLDIIEAGIASAHGIAESRGVWLDSFDGATDDDKLTAAMAYASAQTYKPAILLGPRTYSFNTQRTPYNGFALIGVEKIHNAEKGTGTYQTTRITNAVGSNNAWLQPSGSELWNLTIKNVAFVGNSSTTWLGGGSTVLWCMHLQNLSFSAYRTVLGNQATKLLVNLCLIDGWFSCNNSYNGGMHIGGSDNALFMGLTNIDSGTAFASAGSANGQYHLWLDYLEKTTIGPIYLTGEGEWNGIRVSGPAFNAGGSNLGGPNWITGAKIEGRNAGAPCNGSLIRVEGGELHLRDTWLGYAMASPSTPGHSPTDAGVVHQTAGQVLLDGCTYDRATGVAETVPLLYTAGGVARVRNIFRGSKGGTWSGLPRVSAAASIDDSVTAV